MLLRVAIGDTCRTIRLSKKLTMRQVCEKANVSLGHLSELERGVKEGSSEVWENIANGLGVSFPSIVIEAGYLMSPIPDTAQPLIDEYGRDFTQTARW